MPRLDTRLCMLLSITPLAIANIIKEKVSTESANLCELIENSAARRSDLVSSLQALGNYESLLVPPPLVVSAANQAASKAIMFISGCNVTNRYMDVVNLHERGINCCKSCFKHIIILLYFANPFCLHIFFAYFVLYTFCSFFCSDGNMWHLIVESCISRNLLDTSAYFWPGYVKGHLSQISHTIPSQLPGWSTFMRGAPLNQSMADVLASNPASRCVLLVFRK